MDKSHAQQPSTAFVGAAWLALGAGVVAYLIGLWNATMQLNEKGYYFAILVLGLYAAISLQKAVRDKLEDIPVTNIYYGLSWLALFIAVILLTVGLYNATLQLSEKGFYAMAYVLSLFAAITVQKNTRDLQNLEKQPAPSVVRQSEAKAQDADGSAASVDASARRSPLAALSASLQRQTTGAAVQEK